jgi:integrase
VICRPTSRPVCRATAFASLAADLGYNEPTIASLLGHKMHSITSRYVHSADVVLLAAADAVANATMKLMPPDQPQPQLPQPTP